MQNSELMTVNEVAELVRVDPNTVYLWLKRGLGHYKAGGVVRISPEQLKNFMEARK